MLTVDLIYSGYIYSPNGASMFVKKMTTLTGRFASEGIRLRVFSQDLINPRSFDNADEIRRKVSFRQRVFSLASKSSLLTRIVMYKTMDSYSLSILDYYKKQPEKGDVVAFQEMSTCYHYLRQTKTRKQKVMLTLHNNGDFWSMFALSFPKIMSRCFFYFRKNYENVILQGCDRIGFVAEGSQKKFCSLYHFDIERTYYVYNGLELIPYRKITVDKMVNLVCVGTLCDRKNQNGILNAISMLSVEYQQQITLTLVGDGVTREELEVKAKTLRSEVLFTGSSDCVDSYLQRANCFILFSKDEGLPISIVEAMRAGLPIIGTNIAGIPEQIINGKTGFLIDVDEKQLCDILKWVVDNKIQLVDMGAASYQYFIEKFSIDGMVKKYSSAYQS